VSACDSDGRRAGEPIRGRQRQHLRALLSSEPLKDDLGVRVDAKVLDGGGVGGCRRAVRPSGQSTDEGGRRPGMPGQRLHDRDCDSVLQDKSYMRRQRRDGLSQQRDWGGGDPTTRVGFLK